ncbi:PREDICTED: tubulin-specific chaperone B-like [Fragaria vesca subsp. vesca]
MAGDTIDELEEAPRELDEGVEMQHRSSDQGKKWEGDDVQVEGNEVHVDKDGEQRRVGDDDIPDNYMEDLCVNIKVGDRCQVEPGDKRGVVKFVGRAESLAPGFWVGVQYDEPLGKHDGMVKGTRYFNCPPLHGAVVRPDKIKVGDYPERDPFEEDEI